MSMHERIPLLDLKAQYATIRSDLEAAVSQVLGSGRYIGGEECRRFEEEFAAYCGVPHACGVANGTDALTIALRAYGIGPGDEVLTVANTFVATGEAILLNGARPVFVDVDPETGTMDPEAIAPALTPRTKVVLPVHLYGHPADVSAIAEVAARHGLPVLEDAAQAHGATLGSRRVGALGHAACFSFYPSKNLGACGDAGAVTSQDGDFIERVRCIAQHGATTHRYEHAVLGTNSRLDAVQAAILRVKLRHLDQWIEERRRRAGLYMAELADVKGLKLPVERYGARSSWYLFTLRTSSRDALQRHLEARGVETAVHYPRPIHLQQAMAPAGGHAGDLPVSEALCREVLSLPLYPELPEASLRRVVDVIRSFAGA
jgi:dTDP-4-amino-4,6-dideoxygalactose transaminase